MIDFKQLRKKVQEHQANLKAFNAFDPVVLCRMLRQCPADAPLEIQWACNTAGRLAGMCFEAEPEEPILGRVRFAEHTADELEEAGRWLKEESPLRGRPCPGQSGHCEVDVELALDKGLDNILEDLRRREKSAEGQRKTTYRSFIIVVEAFSAMIERAATFAGNTACAERCRRIAHQPPSSFYEALQLLWFVEIGIEMGEDASLINPGRLDRRLGKYYDADLAAGNITYQQAVEGIALIYLYINDFCYSGLAFGVMLGGDGVNALSYACVEAVRLSRLVYPSVGLCVNEKMPRDLKRLAIDVISEGYPNPSFFNDRVIRKGLAQYGLKPEEIGNYINSTCVEITPCGASGVWVASPYYNLSQNLLDTLAVEAVNFETFLENYHKQLAADVARGVAEQQNQRRTRMANRRRPLQSVFTRDCIERGLDMELGGARYNWVECSFVGLANLVDSLVVIREEIFKQKNMTQNEMLEILKANFSGHEALRNKLLKGYPKYGWDNAEVDSLIPVVMGYILEECAKYRMPPDDALYIPGTFCWVMHQHLGERTGATPDGRMAGFPFADGAGPAQGREKLGPSAAIKSVCSWNHVPMIGGCAFNMKYTKSLLATNDAREKLLFLVDAFIQGGGFQTQINVADNSLLKKAMEHPEEYSDLVVRIGGYTDYFVRLSQGMQQEILLRTQYEEMA